MYVFNQRICVTFAEIYANIYFTPYSPHCNSIILNLIGMTNLDIFMS